MQKKTRCIARVSKLVDAKRYGKYTGVVQDLV
jgi:hypothetical protein